MAEEAFQPPLRDVHVKITSQDSNLDPLLCGAALTSETY